MEAQAILTKTSPPSQLPLIPKPTHFHNSMKITMTSTSTTTYKDSIDSSIDSHLKQVLTIRPPFDVFKPMHHLVFSTPKNLAPALCIAACEAVGGDRGDALSAAAALHLMHVSAVAHENILLGNVSPKIKYPFGSNIELLTGDALLPLGFEMLARAEAEHSQIDENHADRVVRVIVEISRAIGSRGVVDAQFRTYASKHSKQDHVSSHSEQMWLRKMKAKRSEFHACGGACGAILGGGCDDKVEKMRKCGMFVGMINETLNDETRNGMVDKVHNLLELRDLAMNELESLDSDGIAFISSLLDSVLSCLRVLLDAPAKQTER